MKNLFVFFSDFRLQTSNFGLLKPVTHRRFTRITRRVMVASLLILSMCTATDGQTFIPVQYSFPDSPPEALHSIQFSDNTISRHQFCSMAANGYGQWVFENSGSPGGWLLLSNNSGDENTTTTPPTPNEIVQRGLLNWDHQDPGYTKVTANLNGSVRYISTMSLGYKNIDPNGNITYQDGIGFDIQGFNDQSFVGLVPNENQIDISFTGIPKPEPSTRDVIKKPIYSYTPMAASISIVLPKSWTVFSTKIIGSSVFISYERLFSDETFSCV